ncbi:MAG TPA: DegQ family serine endoprotease [Pseudomonadales bacterium]|nr:DegQ family serine endoprotease [Pseudomonadales bacterium]
MKKNIVYIFVFVFLWALDATSLHARELPDFTQLVEKYSPAVVKIQVETHVQGPQVYGLQPGEEMPEPFRRFFQMPPGQQAPGGGVQRGLGSGFIVDADGYVLTNHHVIKDADSITVRLSDRREFDARVVGSDERSDLALLKVDGHDLPVLHLAADDNLKVGEWVLAIGSPFALDYSVSHGIVSAIGRSLPNERNENYVPFIQTDVQINPGNSGGPLFNMDGDVVGINSQIYTRSGGSMGLSFAIPAGVARNVVSQLKSSGHVSRGWLGVSIQEVDKELAKSFGLSKPEGALVAQLIPGGPAEDSGIQVGDIIISFNGKPILYSSDLPHQVGQVAPGAKARLELMRNGGLKQLTVLVGELPDNSPQLTRNVRSKQAGKTRDITGPLGVVVDALTPQQARQLQITGGVVLRDIKPGGAADKAGLEVGDVITQLGFTPVRNADEFVKIAASLPKGSMQPIRFIRDDRPVFRSVVIE